MRSRIPGNKGPQLVVDDGGDVTLLIHKGCELEEGDKWVDSASSSHEEQVIKNLLKRVAKERPGFWTNVVKELARRFRRNDDRRASPLPDDGSGQAAGAGDQRQRLGHEVEVRQLLRLPRIARRRHQARDGPDGRRQGRLCVRLRRRRQGFGAFAARVRRARDRHRDRSDQCAAGRDGRLRSHHRRRHARPRRHLRHDDRQQGRHHARAHAAHEARRARLQHRPLRQRDPDRSPEARRTSSTTTSSRRSTGILSPTAIRSTCSPKAASSISAARTAIRAS